jgi:hypothetical protein
MYQERGAVLGTHCFGWDVDLNGGMRRIDLDEKYLHPMSSLQN